MRNDRQDPKSEKSLLKPLRATPHSSRNRSSKHVNKEPSLARIFLMQASVNTPAERPAGSSAERPPATPAGGTVLHDARPGAEEGQAERNTSAIRRSGRIAKRTPPSIDPPPARRARMDQPPPSGGPSASARSPTPTPQNRPKAKNKGRKKAPTPPSKRINGKANASAAVTQAIEDDMDLTDDDEPARSLSSRPNPASELPGRAGSASRLATAGIRILDPMHLPGQLAPRSSTETGEASIMGTAPASGTIRPSDTNFRLEDFLNDFDDNVVPAAASRSVTHGQPTQQHGRAIGGPTLVQDELRRLEEEFLSKRQALLYQLSNLWGSSLPPTSSQWMTGAERSRQHGRGNRDILPSLPPPEIAQQRYASFAQFRNRKAKGEYNPTEAQLLTAYRLFWQLADEGTSPTVMQLLLIIREHPAIKFLLTRAVLIALASGRLGSRRLTIMHFAPLSEQQALIRGSTNENFMDDFSGSVQLPVVEARCNSYEQLLTAISSLRSFAGVFWCEHAIVMLDRLKAFVAANQERDTTPPVRLQCTLMYVNIFLGSSLGKLSMDTPEWWSDYCAAVTAIDYDGREWQSALSSLALSLRAPVAESHLSKSAATPLRYSRGPSRRTPIIPDHLRAQIPRDQRGREPCLRFFGGSMCMGGSTTRCSHPDRTHTWTRQLPRDLQEWADRAYGNQRGTRTRENRKYDPPTRTATTEEGSRTPRASTRDSKDKRSPSSRRH